MLAAAVQWALAHQVTDREDAATWLVEHGRDTGIPIAGQGCPLVAQFAVAELATALGLSAGSGRRLVGEALELACRLPRIWARVRSGTLPAWRARRIAEETLCLSPEAAEHVDAQLARYAHKTGPAQTQRLVDAAIARFMPELAAERRQAAADGRHFDIDLDQISFAGTARIDAELDLADALDLDDALRAGAAQLATLGSEDSWMCGARSPPATWPGANSPSASTPKPVRTVVGTVVGAAAGRSRPTLTPAGSGPRAGAGSLDGLVGGRWCSTCTSPTTP